MKKDYSELFQSYWIVFFTFLLGVFSVLDEIIGGYRGFNRFSDDAFYYILPARNFIDYGYFTFDTINETNGFHPLWMLLIAFLFKFVGTSIELEKQIFYVTLLESIVFLSSVVLSSLFLSLLSKRKNPYAAGFIGVLFVLLCPVTASLFLIGMESTLAIFWIVILFYCFITDKIKAISFLMPCLFLTRLDSLVFIILPIILFYLFNKNLPLTLKSKLILSLPLIITVLTYLTYNYYCWGYFKPISGMKSSFPFPTLHFSFFIDPILSLDFRKLYWLVLAPNLTIMLLINISSLYLYSRYFNRLKNEPKIFIFLVMSYLVIANIVLFQKWNKGVEGWYLVVPYIISFFVFLWFLNILFDGKFLKNIFALLLILSFISFLGFNIKYFPKAMSKTMEKNAATDDAIEFLVHNSKKEDVIASTDCGALAFWSNRKIINLDGVINNYDYQKYIKEKKLSEYLVHNNVRYLVVGVMANEQKRLTEGEFMYLHRINPSAVYSKHYQLDFFVYSYLHNNFSDKITLTPELEVWRGTIYKDGTTDARTLIFAIDSN